ncbi:hypothetical protein VSDG_04972 [Cytospora chrysosperma]|uniref:Uncharacterized protein n=1 Tax=Cytospora chrysosperma TaxID=252740 RepID=A0A423VYL1_CYTCH|nr:hypothetical protein VSDG_04972 [Valsa sordida]
MSDSQGNGGSSPAAASSLPPAAIELAMRMYNAAREGNLELLQQAVLAGLPPNMTNEKGDTLLMLAAYYGHAELVKFLIQHGADPNRLNDRLQSPLAGAVFKKEDSVIEVSLISYPPFFPHCVLRWCRAMFKQEEQWKAKFESAPGRGKAAQTSSEVQKNTGQDSVEKP